MIHKLFTDRLLTCCRTQEELSTLRDGMEAGNYAVAHQIQSNIRREKTGYRCADCGKFYPFLSIHHQGVVIDPKSLSRPIGRLLKFKKASDVFRGDHYYATNKKSLLRFDISGDGIARQTEAFPIMTGVYHVDVSPDEGYIATETFGNTIAVIDTQTKETVARKRGCDLNGAFRFDHGNRFLYYMDRAIRCWDFLENREWVLWQVPKEWSYRPDSDKEYAVSCSAVLRPDRERIVFQIKGAGNHAVVLRDLDVQGVYPLADSWVLSELSYAPELDQFTLADQDSVYVYDGGFRLTDVFPYPMLQTYQDGGGVFPVTEFGNSTLHHAYLSLDGKWVLLDYFNQILLMERKTGKLRYCVYSDNGGASRFMGFRDETHIWYNWGNSTCIMELPEQENI